MFIETEAFDHWVAWMTENGMSEIKVSERPMQPNIKAVWREHLVHGYKQVSGYDIYCSGSQKDFEDLWSSYLMLLQKHQEEEAENGPTE